MAEMEQTATAAGKAVAVVTRVRTMAAAMPPERRRWMLAAGAMLAAVVAATMWYAGRTDWRVLFSGLEGRDVQQVSQELGAAGIRFQTTADGGGVEVPAELLDKARMEVAAKGMPQSGRLGFELFDKPNWVGSEFDERVNYQRALEGELEHTIGTLGVVRSARVHLVLPQATLFAGEEKVAKASVVLRLRKAVLSAEQTDGIRNLVAGAVENLSPEQVTLVDAEGRADLRKHGDGNAIEADQEQAMEVKLVAMLEPLAGTGNVRATVNVAYEQGTEERTDEVYDPALVAATSVQKSEQTSGAAARASGVPGTASNTPAAAPVGAVQGSATAAGPATPPLLQAPSSQSKADLPVWPGGASPTQTSRQETGTYAVTRHLVHAESGPGRVRRVTAAIVVNDREAMETVGKAQQAVWKPRTPEEMHRLEELAQAAVGFDAKRGDHVVMQNVSFNSNLPETKAAGLQATLEQVKELAMSQAGLLRTGMVGLLGLLMVMFVLRPVASSVAKGLTAPLALTAGSATQVAASRIATVATAAALSSESEAAAVAGLSAPMNVVPATRPRAGMLDQVAEQIRREPEKSTRLLGAWIGNQTTSDEEEAG